MRHLLALTQRNQVLTSRKTSTRETLKARTQCLVESTTINTDWQSNMDLLQNYTRATSTWPAQYNSHSACSQYCAQQMVAPNSSAMPWMCPCYAQNWATQEPGDSYPEYLALTPGRSTHLATPTAPCLDPATSNQIIEDDYKLGSPFQYDDMANSAREAASVVSSEDYEPTPPSDFGDIEGAQTLVAISRPKSETLKRRTSATSTDESNKRRKRLGLDPLILPCEMKHEFMPTPISPDRHFSRIVAEKLSAEGMLYKVVWRESWVHATRLRDIDAIRHEHVQRFGQAWSPVFSHRDDLDHV